MRDQAAGEGGAIPLDTDDFKPAVAEYEAAVISRALEANRYNQRATAEALGLSYDQLRHAMKRLKLNADAA